MASCCDSAGYCFLNTRVRVTNALFYLKIKFSRKMNRLLQGRNICCCSLQVGGCNIQFEFVIKWISYVDLYVESVSLCTNASILFFQFITFSTTRRSLRQVLIDYKIIEYRRYFRFLHFFPEITKRKWILILMKIFG